MRAAKRTSERIADAISRWNDDPAAQQIQQQLKVSEGLVRPYWWEVCSDSPSDPMSLKRDASVR